MGDIVLAGATSGTTTLTPAAVSGTTTLTLPATSGTIVTTATSTGISGSAITTGTVGVSVGGTGANTLTANNVILGAGTSAVTFVAPSTTGNLLTSNGTTWTSAAAPSSTPTTAQVLSATAGATAGAVGTYAMLGQNVASTTALTNGTSYAGSGFCHFGINNQQNGNSFTIGSANGAGFGFGSVTPSGTWLCLGSITTTASSYARGTLFLRTA